MGFAKTKLLNPRQKETLTITIDPYDFASYDDRDANNNGFCGYELESGDYDFYISRDAHRSEGKITLNLATDARFEKDNVTNNVVGNRYIKQNNVTATDITGLSDIDAPLDRVLSRSDWTGTWPTPITDDDRHASPGLINELKNVNTNNPNDYYDTEKYEYAVFDQEATVK